MTILITVSFSLLRPHNSVVYAPKVKGADNKHAPPNIGKGVFAWVPPVAKTKEGQLVEKIGLDATVFLRFTRMCRNIFVIISVVGIAILIPTNVIGSDKTQTKDLTEKFFATMSPQWVHGKPLWGHVIGSYLINIVVVFFLWRNYIAITSLRRQYLDSPDYLNSLHSRTLMFTDIPPSLRTDEGILRIADGVEHTAGIPRGTIGRNVKELPELIEEHQTAVRKLESVLSKYLKNPDNLPTSRPTLRPPKDYRKNNGGERVDAIDYLTARIRELEAEINHVRESIDKRNPMPFGFASYDRIEDAHTVAYAARRKHPQGSTIRLAPKPNDLIWKNLPLTKTSRSWKRFMNNFWILVLTFIWIAPNAMIAIFLSNLSNLTLVWPAFKTNFDGHHLTWSAVQGIASPALTSLVYLILPIIFRRLSIRAGDTTKVSRERHVTTKLYAFFVFNNLIVFSVFSSMWAFIAAVVSLESKESFTKAITDGKIVDKMMTGLVQIAPFWLTWLLQRNLGAAIDISQVWNLIWIWFARTFMSPTPRQSIEWTAPTPFDYASYYNYFLFYSTVALCFATLQPLVLPVTAFYFAIDYWMKKYLLLYVMYTKSESGGQFWTILYNRLIFATILSNFIIALILGSHGTRTMVFCMIPLPILMLLFKWYCSATFDDRNTYYTTAVLKDPEHLHATHKHRHNDHVSRKFGHPALHKPLLTPMVHAKAQHVLSQIYRGRLDPDEPSGTSYRDIAMDSMSRSQPGKAARAASSGPTQKDMFEVVPESQLDFAYYKHRTEFADQYGGDGELYGKPTDLISERSATPRSFLARGDDSPSSSRASSPGPNYGAGRRGLIKPNELGFSDQLHPSYRDQGDLGNPGYSAGPGIYRLSNESESRLLSSVQPLGVSTPEAEIGREQYGLDRWRTGGTGYVGVPGAEEEGQGRYETYRGQGRG